MMRTFLVLIVFLFIAITKAPVLAQDVQKGYSYAEIEQAMIDGDFAEMLNQAKFLEYSLAHDEIQSMESQFEINEALGLLYLQLGYIKDVEVAVNRCNELLELQNLDSLSMLLRIDFVKFMCLIQLQLRTDIEYPEITLLPSMDDATKQYYYLNKGILSLLSQDYESAVEEMSLALELSLKSDERWAVLTRHRILDLLVDNYISKGEYDTALSLLSIKDDWLTEARQNRPENHQDYGYYDMSSGLVRARIYMLVGNFSKAQESLNIVDRHLAGKGSIVTGLHFELLELKADLLFEQMQYVQALDYYEQASSIMESLGGSDLWIGIKKMICAYRTGREEDWKSIARVLSAAKFKGGEISFQFDFILQYANILVADGYDNFAIQLLDMSEMLMPYINLDYDSSLNYNNLRGAIRINEGDYLKAVELYTAIVSQERQRAHDIFAFLPEGQRELYWKKKESLMNNIFRLNQVGTVTAARGSVFEINKGDKNISSAILYDASLLNKGLLLEAFLNMQRMITSSGDQELIAAFNELRKLKGSDRQRADALEATIISKLSSYGDFMDFTHITWEDVRDNLDEDEAAVEFVVSEDDDVSYYSAEILRKGYDRPEHVFLFAQKNEAAFLKGMDVYEDDRLYKKTWGKMSKYLEGCKDVYFAPVGEFHRIGMEYLPVNESLRVNDLYNVHRLSSTKLLVRSKDALRTMHTSSAALYGGLDYNLDSENMEYYAYAAQTGKRGQSSLKLSDVRSLDDMIWGYLPGTEAEVMNVSEILQDMKCDTDMYTGGEGVEESFKLLDNKSPEIIHVATHGFFFEPSKDISLTTGLVFAGANNHSNVGLANKGIDDGFLTSKEIAGLNLSGAELVVLSACQTAAGEISGEGVFGLQRGFKKACAGTLLMSLWEVDDNATDELMTHFYSCISKGMEKHAALKEAQSHVKRTCGEDPALWAGFILLD